MYDEDMDASYMQYPSIQSGDASADTQVQDGGGSQARARTLQWIIPYNG